MAIFLTGATGYIGAHVAANLLDEHGASLNLLVRARDPREAEDRLWHSLQLHLDFKRFYEYLQTRIRIFRGDLTSTLFGLSTDEYDRMVDSDNFVVLDGTLPVNKLQKQMRDIVASKIDLKRFAPRAQESE